jgi:HK97 family phage portal protein
MFNRVIESSTGGDKLEKPYQSSTWVMRAIKKVADPIAAMPLVFYSGESEVEDEALDLFWKAPAVRCDYSDFIQASVGWLKLAGETFWLLDDTLTAPFPRARGELPKLILARPDRMNQVVNGSELVGWRYLDGQGNNHALLPENVIQLKLWNPYDDIRGLGEYEACRIAAEGDYAAGQFARNLNQQNGDTGPYVVCKTGLLNGDQRDFIVAQLREKRAAALRGEFRPAFLTGDITVDDPQVHVPDQAFLNSRLQNRHEIAIAFGVPPSMFDVVASYSIGSASDRFMLIEETCKPLAVKLCAGMAQVASKIIGGVLTAECDWDEHSTMQQVRAERLTSALTLWDRGMSWEAVNEYLNLGMPEFDGWDSGYLPFSLAPVGSSALSGEPNEPEPATEEPAIEAMKIALREAPPKEKTDAEKVKEFLADRDPGEARRWEHYWATRQATIGAFQSKHNRELTRVRSEVLSNIFKEAAHATKGIVTREGAGARLMFDLGKYQSAMMEAFGPIMSNALNKAAREVWDELRVKDDPWIYESQEVKAYLAQRKKMIDDASKAEYDQIKTALDKGMDAGESYADLADRVREVFNGISKGRARTIAMTETSAAYGQGRHDALAEAGVTKKKWLASGNPNMRPAHAEANGQVVGIDEPFIVDGEALDHPGDPNGSPGNVINCHCVEVAVIEGNEP